MAVQEAGGHGGQVVDRVQGVRAEILRDQDGELQGAGARVHRAGRSDEVLQGALRDGHQDRAQDVGPQGHLREDRG